MVICGIYKITNLINSKVYIEQSINIYQRWSAHKYTAFNQNNREYNIYFHNALRKYGIENFSFEIIEECSKEFLNEREIYWINYFNSSDRNFGYNETLGGNNGTKDCYHIQQYDLDGNFIKEWESVTEASKALNTSVANIRVCLLNPNHQKSAAGFQWKRSDDNRLITKYVKDINYAGLETGWNLAKTPISAYDNDNNLIQSFSSRKDATVWLKQHDYTKAKNLKGVQARLSTVVNKNQTAYGFYWKDGDCYN